MNMEIELYVKSTKKERGTPFEYKAGGMTVKDDEWEMSIIDYEFSPEQKKAIEICENFRDKGIIVEVYDLSFLKNRIRGRMRGVSQIPVVVIEKEKLVGEKITEENIQKLLDNNKS
jgi:hypothetical protein